MYGLVATEFQTLLRSASAHYDTQQDLADALGISVARLNRALNKGDYPLSAQNCLRLALVAGQPASVILRAAGKTDLADLIERLYGRSDLTPMQREVLEEWALLPPEVQTVVLQLMRVGNAARRRSGGASRPQPAPHVEPTPAARRRRRAG
jgi:transcriptional regulator with XRE-family HTH domain